MWRLALRLLLRPLLLLLHLLLLFRLLLHGLRRPWFLLLQPLQRGLLRCLLKTYPLLRRLWPRSLRLLLQLLLRLLLRLLSRR